MENRTNLHDYERLLCAIRPSPAALLRALLRATVLGILFAIPVFLMGWLLLFAVGFGSYGILAFAPAIVPPVLCWWHAAEAWHRSSLRLTSERILLEYKKGIAVQPVLSSSLLSDKSVQKKARPFSLVTIKWTQYQESTVPSPGLLDVLCGSRSLAIRYGSADGQVTALFPSLPFARDLKHYLDKVDAAVRTGKADEVREFILKPKGQRY